ncbi:MAG: hypothetical protein M1820_007915 [Bogoriella megaspora]|nr:MAG: hypothetical protein M1820_007915 [Bogoriella megaspora]
MFIPAVPLVKRYRCNNNYNSWDDDYDCSSSWNSWVRWVVVVIIIVAFLTILFLFSCITARRRRRLGQRPYYGTGWLAGQHGPVTYNPQPYYNNNPQNQQPSNNYNYGNQAPPAYTQSQGQNASYYGGRDGVGYEMQPPQQAHYQPDRSGEDVYAPPAGAPPKKGYGQEDGVIR